MSNHKISRLLLLSLVIACLISACGGPFTIKHEKFAADDACDAEGTIELRMEGGKLRSVTGSDFQVFMRKSGFPSAWCHGVRHVWKGKATYEGYTFESSPDDPLQFVVDRSKGYVYVEGKGTVTTPEGKVVDLP